MEVKREISWLELGATFVTGSLTVLSSYILTIAYGTMFGEADELRRFYMLCYVMLCYVFMLLHVVWKKQRSTVKLPVSYRLMCF
jgi:hypothetical protein